MPLDSPQTKYSEQNVLNNVYDQSTRTLATSIYGWDGTGAQPLQASAVASKITTVGAITYIGIAAPGTTQATAKWQCKKIDASDSNNVTITWANGGAFSQVATDLTALTYL